MLTIIAASPRFSINHQFENCKKEGPANITHQRYSPALRLWTEMKLVITVPLFVALLCVTAGMRKSVVRINSVLMPPGLNRLVSFHCLLLSWLYFETRKAHSKQERNDQVFKDWKLSTSGQDQSKKLIKSGFQTQWYNHKNCYTWSMQAGPLYASLVKAESYASEARISAENLSDSNDNTTYTSGQYTYTGLSVYAFNFTKFKKRYSQRGWHTTKSRAHCRDACSQRSLK